MSPLKHDDEQWPECEDLKEEWEKAESTPPRLRQQQALQQKRSFRLEKQQQLQQQEQKQQTLVSPGAMVGAASFYDSVPDELGGEETSVDEGTYSDTEREGLEGDKGGSAVTVQAGEDEYNDVASAANTSSPRGNTNQFVFTWEDGASESEYGYDTDPVSARSGGDAGGKALEQSFDFNEDSYDRDARLGAANPMDTSFDSPYQAEGRVAGAVDGIGGEGDDVFELSVEHDPFEVRGCVCLCVRSSLLHSLSLSFLKTTNPRLLLPSSGQGRSGRFRAR